MTFTTTTHLNFDGNAAEVLAFYADVFGVEAASMTYGRMGASTDPAWADRIIWGQVATPSGFRVMAFDVWPGQPYDQGANAFYVYLQSDDADELRSVWKGLSAGAEIRQDFGPSAWSPLAGQLRDRFGVVWQLDVLTAQSAG